VIQPELKHLLCPDVVDLKAYRPGTAAFSLFVQAVVGPRGAEGEESFGFTICTPDWMKERCVAEPLLGLHHLIVPSYNYDQIVLFVSRFVDRCAAETWQQVACKLQQLGSWEFEDYQPGR
jgi:hypothetical protein